MKLNYLFSFVTIALLFEAALLHADARDVRIGYLLDLSAKGAFLGMQSQAGAELARRELASKGIRVNLVYDDHRTDAKNGATGAKKLLEIDNVNVLLCDLTPPCMAASPVAAAAKRLFLYQAPVVSLLADNEHAFKNFLDYESGCRQIANLWKREGIKTVAHFKVNAEFGELCLKGSKEIIPDQIVFEYDAGTDLRALVTRLRTQGVQAVFQTGYEADYVNRIRAAAELGFMVPNGMPQPLLTDTVLTTLGSVPFENSLVFGFPKLAEDFVERLKKAGLFRSFVSIESAAIAYLHVKHAAVAILACPPQDISCQVNSISSSGADSILGFEGWENRQAQYPIILRRMNAGKLTEIKQ